MKLVAALLAMDATDICIGYGESLSLVYDAFESQGPFDGILGFSQGASFVSLLFASLGDPDSPIKFKFAILIAGFKSLLSPHTDLYRDPIECPTFLTIGSTDDVIPTHASEDLLAICPKGTAYRHGGGHYVPASPQLRTAMLEFLAPHLQP